MGKAWMPVQNFKKVHEDGRKVILEHPDGHSVTLSKAAMSDHMKAQVAGLSTTPRMAKGGKVQKMDDGGAAQPDEGQDSLMGKIGGFLGKNVVNPLVEGTKADLALAGKGWNAYANGANSFANGVTGTHIPMIQQQPQGAPQQQPQQQGPGGPGQGPGLENFGGGQGGGPGGPGGTGGMQNDTMFQKYYKNQANSAQLQSKAFGDYINQQKALAGRSMQLQNQMMDDYTAFKSDYMKGHIDPNHYMESLSTGGKIATAIGVVLGGIGGGMQGTGHNAALDFLNQQINRDINSQVQNMNNKVNLMRVNMQMYGNMQQAIQATTAQEYGIMSARIQQIGAQTQNKQAQMMAQQLSMGYDQKASSAFQGLARAKAMEEVYGVKPDQMIPGGGPNGQAAYGLDAEAAKEARAKLQGLDDFGKNLQALQQNKTQNGANFTSPFVRGSVDEAQRNAAADSLGIAEHGTRYNQSMRDQYLKDIPSPGQWKQGQAQAQLNELRARAIRARNAALQNQSFGAPQKPETDSGG